jgi:peptidoglycan/LPS O-acetylase OafA/YrhL
VPATAPAQRRLDRLTSLRFFAALGVVICHVSLLIDSTEHAQVTARLATGVPFFFMLSGFVLTWAHTPSDRAASFWRRRFARIYPLHVVTLVVAVAIVWQLSDRGMQPVLRTVLSLLLLHAWVPDPQVYFASNGVSWTLSVELFFYAVFPWVHPFLARRARQARRGVLAACVAVVALNCAVVPFLPRRIGIWWLEILPLTQLPIFVIGVVLALEVKDGWRPRVPLGVTAAVTAAGIAAAYAVPEPYWRVAPMLIPFALIIVHAVMADLDGRPGLLTHPVLVRLGLWSYALYLCHGLVLTTVGYSLGRQVGLRTGLLFDVVLTVTAIALSAVLHELVERPLERRLRGAKPRTELEPET